MKIQVGQQAPGFEAFDVNGERYSLETLRGKKILLSFFRDATCPFCNLRVYELTRKYPELQQKGLVMLAIFNSPKDRIIRYVGKKSRPFPMIADPEKRLYDLYNVRSSMAGLMLGMFIRFPAMIKAMALGFNPSLRGEVSQMPADFLIGPDLKIKGIYYGKDLADHIPVAILENFAAKQYGEPSQGALKTTPAV